MSPPAIARTELFSYLVTRHTGRAVRTSIERELDGFDRTVLAVLDLTHVELIDFSCADEIVAKLVVARSGPTAGHRRFFLVRGVAERHVEPIESALSRQGLACAAETADGSPLVLGEIACGAERAFCELWKLGRAGPGSLATRLALPRRAVFEALAELDSRSLVIREGARYVSFGRTLLDAPGPGPPE